VSRDAQGWTVVTPSVDSVLIYVSSSGGSDSNTGLSPAQAVQTIAHGISLTQFGRPDELLLKAGDKWYESIGVFRNMAGRSPQEPYLISVYGTGARPQIRTNATTAGMGAMLGHFTNTFAGYVFVISIDFYDSAKDPASPDYQGLNPTFNTSQWNVDGVSWLDTGTDLLFEDCFFHYLANGLVIQYVSGPSPTGITIRRCEITDQYATAGALSQGMYLGGLADPAGTIEENLFDHNAWDPAGAPVSVDPPGVFNHAVYVADGQAPLVQNCMFGTDSSLSLKYVFYGRIPSISTMTNMAVFNNLFYHGEIGISMAGDPGAGCYTTGCILSPHVSYNVMSQINESNPTGRAIGWGSEIKNVVNGLYDYNLMADFSYTNNAFGIAGDDDNNTATSGNNTITLNTFYKIDGPGVSMSPQPNWILSHITSNAIQDPSLGAVLCDQGSTSFSTVAYSGNTYSPTNVNHFATVNGSVVSYATWITDSGETGSQIHTNSYPDPTRNLDSYARNVLGMAGGAPQYLAAIRTASKSNWHPEWLAPAINSYIRAGFNLPDPPSQGTSIGYYKWGAILLFFLAGVIAAVAVRKRLRRRGALTEAEQLVVAAGALEAVREPLDLFSALERETETEWTRRR